MPLQSKLLSGDPKLEAAAISDSAHIVQGSIGDHVRRIQLALIQLDGWGIDVDGIYSTETAAAVLAYKRERDIVNRSYQTQADNIVGKMTIASLDREMFKKEQDPSQQLALCAPVFIPSARGHAYFANSRATAGFKRT